MFSENRQLVGERELLLTPGPLTTSAETRQAMDRDWASRDERFIALSESIRTRLSTLAGVRTTHATVPVQGSGTFAIEAAVGTLVPPAGRLLVAVNGAYGRRIADIARRIGRLGAVIECAETETCDVESVRQALINDGTLTDVAVVHCETTSGILNPLEQISTMVHALGRRLIVDAMSSFGAIPIDGKTIPFTALVASANKGLEGVPGLGFVIADREHLANCRGNSISLCLDLWDQWKVLETTGQWRFTPPVQVVATLDAALNQLDREGGVAARHRRYSENCKVLVEGMTALGFELMVDAAVQAPVIVTFRAPSVAWFKFEVFYQFLARRGIVIYPGKLTVQPSFRIGCIGAVSLEDVRRALGVIEEFVDRNR
ncbi:2-aminoethylphosphonate--pyruvate transaminase [Agrobacterium fabrum]|uniref:2-aminoethylphosphonate--pyruvate transaminase n=1 Tax=Agrobacterium fabrum TaxID=1176649 RepID=UPI003B9E058D